MGRAVDYSKNIEIDLSPENITQIAKYVKLSKRISYFTSYGGNDEAKLRDYEAIKLLCKIILSVNKNTPGFEKIYNKAEIINSNIPTIYNELVPNAQKAIFENLMKDQNLKTEIIEKIQKEKILNILKEKGVEEEKINLIKNSQQHLRNLYLKYRKQIVITDAEWFDDINTRHELIQHALKKDMKIAFFFSFKPLAFEFGTMNRAYVDPIVLKELNYKLDEPVRKGADLINLFNVSDSKIGAGLGIHLTKICIENIVEECNINAHAKYENNSKGMLIMTISLNL